MCEWDSGDDEPCEVYNQTERKARKEHTCDSCHGQICVGETYRYTSGIYDHDPFSFKQCPPCTIAHDLFNEKHDGIGVTDLYEGLDFCVRRDGPTSWAAPLLATMKERLAASYARRAVTIRPTEVLQSADGTPPVTPGVA